MIAYHGTAAVGIAPRFSILGLVRSWYPSPSSAKYIPLVGLGEPALPVRVEALLPEPRVEVVLPEGFSLEPARSYLLGFFDLTPRAEAFSAGTRHRVSPPSEGAGVVERAKDEAYVAKEQLLTAVLQPPLSILLENQQVLDWPHPLLRYQQEGVAALLDRPLLLLADDMGLGKTVQVLAALRILCFRSAISRSLIVCPTSVLRQWTMEIRKWAPELSLVSVNAPAAQRAALWRLPAHIHLVSYDTLRADVLDLQESPVLRCPWDVVVLDEASRIKNRETGVARAAKLLPAQRRWALTGTPLENRVEDVASILDFLLAIPPGRPRSSLSVAEARSALPNYQLRRRKEDVLLDLPAKRVIELFLDLAPSQRESYARAENEGVVALREKGALATIDNVLTLIVRLKQICNADPLTGESCKLIDIRERLERLVAEGHRALIFSQFTHKDFGVQRVVDALSEFGALALTGDMSQSRRNQVIDTFFRDDRHKALVLSLRAGGVGLNLQEASYVFHLDRWWNPAIEDQAESRAHRMGQENPVTVYRYICTDTIEERIHNRLEEKRALFRDVVDDVSIGLTRLLSAEDLFGLFGLSAPAEKASKLHITDPDFARMTGEEFEHWLRLQLEHLGYQASLTQRSHDGGIDVIASRKDEVGLESTLLIQCKCTQSVVGVDVVRGLRGAIPDRSAGATPIVACPAGFSADARTFATQAGVRLWGRGDLLRLCDAAQTASSSSP